MNRNLDLMAAIQIAVQAEQNARAFYLDAQEKVSDPQAQDLLLQLAAYEQYHLDRLTALHDSLSQDRGFIVYSPPNITLPSVSHGIEGGRSAREHHLETVVEVLGTAIDAEKSARSRYEELAEQTTDAEGRAMFLKLAEEENVHYRILSDELYHLSNRGVWVWSE